MREQQQADVMDVVGLRRGQRRERLFRGAQLSHDKTNLGEERDCHRDPAPYLRPRERVTDMNWQPPADAEEAGYKLMAQYDVQPRTSCTTCHR